jgi:hypothetical protein
MQQQDQQHLWLPFQMAALSQPQGADEASSSKDTPEHQQEHFGTVFELLRAAPSAILQ